MLLGVKNKTKQANERKGERERREIINNVHSAAKTLSLADVFVVFVVVVVVVVRNFDVADCIIRTHLALCIICHLTRRLQFFFLLQFIIRLLLLLLLLLFLFLLSFSFNCSCCCCCCCCCSASVSR